MEPLNHTVLFGQALVSNPTPEWSAPTFYYSVFVLSLLGVFWVNGFFSKTQGNALVDVPIVGPEDTIQARYKFFQQAEVYVKQGYDRVSQAILELMFSSGNADLSQFKDSMFKLSGQDILILPRKYVDELRNMPDHKLSSIQANIDVSEIPFSGCFPSTPSSR